jgi:RND family efflux transporter MFP subunit
VGAGEFDDASSKVQVAEAQFAGAEATVAAAKADVKIKRGKLEHGRAALRTASASVHSARSLMYKAHIQTGFTQLKAAFDGVVTRRTIDPGNFVQPSDSRLLSPLLTVQRIDTLRVVVHVFNEHAPLIKRGMPVEINLPGVQGGDYKISRFSPSLEGGNREMTVEIDMPNPDNRLLPGMAGEVRLPLKKTSLKSLIVPLSCVMPPARDPARLALSATYVCIIREGKANKKSVSVGYTDGKEAEIFGNVQASDEVILKPGKIEDGTPVRIEETP